MLPKEIRRNIKSGHYAMVSLIMSGGKEEYTEFESEDKKYISATTKKIIKVEHGKLNIVITLNSGSSYVLRYQDAILRDFILFEKNTSSNRVSLSIDLPELQDNKPVMRPEVHWVDQGDTIYLANRNTLLVMSPDLPDVASVRVGKWSYYTEDTEGQFVVIILKDGWLDEIRRMVDPIEIEDIGNKAASPFSLVNRIH